MRSSNHSCFALLMAAATMISAAFGAADSGGGLDKITTMPAFVVRESLTWRYVAHPQFEILADAPDEIAVGLAAELPRNLQLADLIVPPSARLRLSDPMILVLDARHTSGRRAWQHVPSRYHAHEDSFVGYMSWPEKDPDPAQSQQRASDFVLHQFLPMMLARSVPYPEFWLCRSVEGFLQTAHLHGTQLLLDGLGDPSAGTGRRPAQLMPLTQVAKILGKPRKMRKNDDDEAWANHTAKLWVRWAWFGGSESERARFWEFYRRSALAPESGEALFRECFGLSHAEVMARLETFRTEAKSPMTIDLGRRLGPAVEPSRIRDAYLNEICRITGEWSRIAARTSPLIREELIASAGRSFTRGLNTMTRFDDKLVAGAGIFFAQTGQDKTARPLLEKAAATGVLRPRAYLELARIQLGTDGPHSVEDTARILATLARAYERSNQQEQYFELLATLWRMTRVKPSRGDLSGLVEGARFFPLKTEFVLRVAKLHALHGFADDVKILCEEALRNKIEAGARAEFEVLRKRVEAGLPDNKMYERSP